MTTSTMSNWAGIGRKMEESEHIPTAIRNAGLNWDVEQRPLFIGQEVNSWDEEGVARKFIPTEQLAPKHVANYRSDTNDVLAVVGSNYEVFQNDELGALVEAVEQESEAVIESLGSFRGGRDVFFLMKNSSFELPGEDEVHTYHFFGNNHAGERGLTVLPTSFRPFCSNMLNMLLQEGRGTGFKIKHTSSMRGQIQEAITALRKSGEEAARFQTQCEQLAKARVLQSDIEDYFEDCYKAQYGEVANGIWEQMDRGEKSKITRAEEIKSQWFINLAEERRRTKEPTTLWNAMNAVTEWIDHGRTVRGEKKQTGLRAHSNILGSAAKAKEKVFKLALAEL